MHLIHYSSPNELHGASRCILLSSSSFAEDPASTQLYIAHLKLEINTSVDVESSMVAVLISFRYESMRTPASQNHRVAYIERLGTNPYIGTLEIIIARNNRKCNVT
jgi:hypothetical protein